MPEQQRLVQQIEEAVATAHADGIKYLGVGAVVVDDQNRVLLVRRSGMQTRIGQWEPPGGGVDSGESILIAAHRELREETGIQGVPVERLVGAKTVLSSSLGEEIRLFFLLFARISQETVVTLSHEHDQHVWADDAELDRLHAVSIHEARGDVPLLDTEKYLLLKQVLNEFRCANELDECPQLDHDGRDARDVCDGNGACDAGDASNAHANFGFGGRCFGAIAS